MTLLALDKGKLETELLDMVFDPEDPSVQASFTQIAAAWASAYASYAADAEDCLTNNPVLDMAEAALSTALDGVFAGSLDKSTTASGMEAAFIAFWGTATFGGVPGVMPPGLASALLAQWATVLTDAAVAANIHATILDTITRTVVVDHSPACTGTIT